MKTSTSCSAPATDLALGFLLGTSPNATSRVTLGLVTPPFFHYCLLFLSCTLLTQPFHLKSGCYHLSGHVPPLDTALWGSCSCPVFPAALPTLPQDFHLPDHLWCLHPRSPLGASHEDLAWFPCQCPCCAQPGLVPPGVTLSHTGLSSCCLPHPSQGLLPGPCCDFAEGKARCLLAGRPSSQARVLRAALPSPASWWLCHHEGAALPWASCPHTLLAAASQAGFVTGGWGCAGRW